MAVAPCALTPLLTEIARDFRQASSADELWGKLHVHLRPYGITGLLYGANARPRDDKRTGLLLHSMRREWLEHKLRSHLFYCCPYVRASRRGGDPILWSDRAILADIDLVARRSLALDHDYKVLTGVTLPMHHQNGRLVSATGCHAPDLSHQEFDTLWASHGQHIQAVIRLFDTFIRQRFRHTLFPLSPRERECLHLLAQGLRPDAIAAVLGNAGKTVSNEIQSMRRKLGADTNAEAVCIAETFDLL